MRTNEERTRLIHKRTAEIKRENQKKKQRRLDAALHSGLSAAGGRHWRVDARPDGGCLRKRRKPCFGRGKPCGKPCGAGLYPDGTSGLFAGRVRDGAFVPSAPQEGTQAAGGQGR